MYKIKMLNDITIGILNNTLTTALGEYLENYFKNLYVNLGDGESFEDFNLESHGYLVILTPNDSKCALDDIGLDADSGGIVSTIPEFVYLINLKSTCYYEVGVLYNNEYMMVFYIEKGIHSKVIDNFLDEYIVI
ncbi:MAG: hypothetical protein WBL93_10490 [Lutisporaceae bacterium]